MAFSSSCGGEGQDPAEKMYLTATGSYRSCTCFPYVPPPSIACFQKICKSRQKCKNLLTNKTIFATVIGKTAQDMVLFEENCEKARKQASTAVFVEYHTIERQRWTQLGPPKWVPAASGSLAIGGKKMIKIEETYDEDYQTQRFGSGF